MACQPATTARGAKLQTPMGDFSQMRQALTSGVIDGYISERPEAMTAETANKAFKMITLTKGFTVSESDAAIAIGMKKETTALQQSIKCLMPFLKRNASP